MIPRFGGGAQQHLACAVHASLLSCCEESCRERLGKIDLRGDPGPLLRNIEAPYVPERGAPEPEAFGVHAPAVSESRHDADTRNRDTNRLAAATMKRKQHGDWSEDARDGVGGRQTRGGRQHGGVESGCGMTGTR